MIPELLIARTYRFASYLDTGKLLKKAFVHSEKIDIQIDFLKHWDSGVGSNPTRGSEDELRESRIRVLFFYT